MSPQGAQELLQLIQDGLADEHLFPKINLSACHPVTSLYQLQKSAPMLALSGLFTDSQLDPRVGYNQGTGDLSITVIMPRDSQFKQEKR
jgi:hypothetical protein